MVVLMDDGLRRVRPGLEAWRLSQGQVQRSEVKPSRRVVVVMVLFCW